MNVARSPSVHLLVTQATSVPVMMAGPSEKGRSMPDHRMIWTALGVLAAGLAVLGVFVAVHRSVEPGHALPVPAILAGVVGLGLLRLALWLLDRD